MSHQKIDLFKISKYVETIKTLRAVTILPKKIYAIRLKNNDNFGTIKNELMVARISAIERKEFTSDLKTHFRYKFM